MLDTNVTSAALRGDQVIKDRLTDLPPGSWCISAVTAAEHLYGLAKKPAAARLAELVHAFLEVAVVTPWDRSAAAELGQLRAHLERQRHLTYLFISHNLAVVRHVSDQVGVMYLGRLVELADKHTLFDTPRHPYTVMLLDAIPKMHDTGKARTPVQGEVPNPLNPPPGCAFNPRCPHVNERCRTERPQLLTLRGIRIACHAVEEGRI